MLQLLLTHRCLPLQLSHLQLERTDLFVSLAEAGRHLSFDSALESRDVLLPLRIQLPRAVPQSKRLRLVVRRVILQRRARGEDQLHAPNWIISSGTRRDPHVTHGGTKM